LTDAYEPQGSDTPIAGGISFGIGTLFAVSVRAARPAAAGKRAITLHFASPLSSKLRGSEAEDPISSKPAPSSSDKM